MKSFIKVSEQHIESHCSAADAAGMADKIYQTSLAGLDKFSAEILEAELQIQQEEALTDL